MFHWEEARLYITFCICYFSSPDMPEVIVRGKLGHLKPFCPVNQICAYDL